MGGQLVVLMRRAGGGKPFQRGRSPRPSRGKVQREGSFKGLGEERKECALEGNFVLPREGD